MSYFKISTDFTDYDQIIEQATITVDENMFILVKPIEKTTVENNVITKEDMLECTFTDNANSYTHTWTMTRVELKQFVKLFQDIQEQMQTKPSQNTGGCSR